VLCALAVLTALIKYSIMNYLELAKEQFYILKEETLDEDRHLVGAGNSEDYEIKGVKFSIEVNGFWEKSTWFDWVAKDEKGEKLDSGTEY
tara:strand:+ start:400 stop:669 length:270 start_codon:yes stop_codon:yes gene_type:complete